MSEQQLLLSETNDRAPRFTCPEIFLFGGVFLVRLVGRIPVRLQETDVDYEVTNSRKFKENNSVLLHYVNNSHAPLRFFAIIYATSFI